MKKFAAGEAPRPFGHYESVELCAAGRRRGALSGWMKATSGAECRGLRRASVAVMAAAGARWHVPAAPKWARWHEAPGSVRRCRRRQVRKARRPHWPKKARGGSRHSIAQRRWDGLHRRRCWRGPSFGDGRPVRAGRFHDSGAPRDQASIAMTASRIVEGTRGLQPQPRSRQHFCMAGARGRSPLISLGRSPTRPMAWRTKKRRSAGTRLTAARPMSRASAERLDVVGEQPVQQIGGGHHGEVVGPPPLRVALQRVGAADIEAQPLAVDQHLDQGRDVAHTEIVALAGDGMDAVRGVAHQHQTRVDVALGMDQARADATSAGPSARHGRDSRRSGARTRPGSAARRARAGARRADRRARSIRSTSDARRSRPSRHRQDGEGAAGQELLLGDAAMRSARGAPPARWRPGRTTRCGRRCRPPRAWCRSGPRPRRPGGRRCGGRSSARGPARSGSRSVSTTSSGAHQLDHAGRPPTGAAAPRAESGSRRSSPSAPPSRRRRRPRDGRNGGTSGLGRPSWPASEMRMSRIGSAWPASSGHTPSAANRRWLV